nr:hypothetical protein [Tanacetum cinerariifolium]
MKVKESLNKTFNESPPPTKLSPLVDDDVGEEEAIKRNTKVVNNNNEEGESIEVDEIVNIKESKNHPLDQIIGNLNQRILRLKAFLIKHEYLMGMVDNTLFTKKSKSHLIIVQIYIDDIIFGSTSQCLCDNFEKIMHDEFEMSMMEELKFFLGIQIKQVEDEIFFNQSKYIKEMLKKFELEDSKPTKTSMSTKIKLTKDDEADSVDSSKYRGMIGSLLYLTASRPDIMFSVCLCVHFQENPKTTHLEVVKRIFRYIRGTTHLGLCYSKGTRIETIVYAKSDHAGDYVDRKSINGVCTFMGCCLTSWFAEKQKALAISKTKAEFVFAGKACEITTYINQMDYKRTKEYLPRVYRSRQVDKELRESNRTLEKRLFHEGRIVTPSFIAENNMLSFFQDVGLEPFLTLNEPIYIPRNPSKEKEKKIASPSVISSSSSSSDDNEGPSFLKFFDELSDNEDLTNA